MWVHLHHCIKYLCKFKFKFVTKTGFAPVLPGVQAIVVSYYLQGNQQVICVRLPLTRTVVCNSHSTPPPNFTKLGKTRTKMICKNNRFRNCCGMVLYLIFSLLAGVDGFEPTISTVTGWHVWPLHHTPLYGYFVIQGSLALPDHLIQVTLNYWNWIIDVGWVLTLIASCSLPFQDLPWSPRVYTHQHRCW